MPAWPGGPCPNCGEDMPENLIHCQSCRSLLNPELQPDSVEIPAFIPLEEIESMIEVAPAGHYVGCPHCHDELRIAAKYVGRKVQCKFCSGSFDHTVPSPRIKAVYMECPHCLKELKASVKYLGMKVACKFCGGRIKCVTVKTS